MTIKKLKPYTVYIRRKGGNTKGRIEVMAKSEKHSHRVAICQLIEVSYPKTKPSNWLVTCTEERKV